MFRGLGVSLGMVMAVALGATAADGLSIAKEALRDGLWEIAHPAALLILSAMALAGNSYNPFLYFQF